ncbi:hypothetical protein STEG23_029936 [Scotinomys teguina]
MPAASHHLMAAMLLLGMKGSPLLVQRTVTRTIVLQETIGKANSIELNGEEPGAVSPKSRMTRAIQCRHSFLRLCLKHQLKQYGKRQILKLPHLLMYIIRELCTTVLYRCDQILVESSTDEAEEKLRTACKLYVSMDSVSLIKYHVLNSDCFEPRNSGIQSVPKVVQSYIIVCVDEMISSIFTTDSSLEHRKQCDAMHMETRMDNWLHTPLSIQHALHLGFDFNIVLQISDFLLSLMPRVFVVQQFTS